MDKKILVITTGVVVIIALSVMVLNLPASGIIITQKTNENFKPGWNEFKNQIQTIN